MNLATGLFHCSSCHHAGNVLDFVHRMETLDGAAVSLWHSALKIAEFSGIDLPGGKAHQTPRRRVRRRRRARRPEPVPTACRAS